MSKDDLQNYVSCDILFGVVHVGTTVVKSYPIKNKHFDAVTFYVTRNTQTNPIYYVFDVSKYEAKVDGGGEFILKISYTPNIPGNKDFDCFNVTDGRQNFVRLNFRGECIGPSVTTSIRHMTFYQTPKFKLKKNAFVLRNSSKVAAIFQFDVGEEPGAFSVEPIKGTLGPDENQYVTVRFSPQEAIFYSRQLCCLILHHEPLIVNLFGICSDDDYDSGETEFRTFPFPFEETVSFRGYLSDSVTLKHVPPPISLTVNYLDFGRMTPESSCQTLTTSFTNHMDTEVKVEWESVKLFKIYPEKLEIPPKQSALYECRFHPDDSERLSSAIVNGHVTWTTECHAVNIPIPINLRFIGHTFPKNHGWISSISIVPNNVILPLSIPNFPSWTTFMIRSYSHLPVLYKLVPPTKTSFIMKPMVGLIRNYQIITVQLESNSFERKSYVEKWSIELNGQVDKCTMIYVKAQTDVPRVAVANDNLIRFETMQPGTEVSVYVPIRNTSFCQLQYEFQVDGKFGVDPPKGILTPNEEIYAIASYTADLDESDETTMEVICRVRSICNDGALIGEPYDVIVTVITEVTYSELCALPQFYECGEVKYETNITTCFYLFNFGESNINFKLSHDHDLKDVVLTPTFGKCGPKEKLMIRVDFAIKKLGKYTLYISYDNRKSHFSEQTVENGGTKSVFRIEYHCVFPTLQIVDLLEHNFGHLFSNSELWELFKIDEINAALIETNEGEIKRVDLSVPDCEISDKLFYLVFAIKNDSNIYTRLVLKRRQICYCKQKESKESLTFRVKVYDCPHKDMFTMEIPSPSMPAQMTQSLGIKIKYLLPHQNVLSYSMELGNQRTIILNIFIDSIPTDCYFLSVFGHSYTLNMGYVFIGLREAPVFAYWLYNHTNNPVPYNVDDLEIVKLCNTDGFAVLKCLTSRGFLKPQSSAPLLFKFWPIEVKRYAVSVPLILGMKETKLQIEGYGTDRTNKCDFTNFTTLVPNPIKNKPINISVDRLIVEPILVSNFTERMFFIRNSHRSARVKYSWKPCFVDGLVKIEPLNPGGILNPRESHPVIIKITSLSEPCSIQILFCLEFVDYEKLIAYEEAEVTHKKKRRSSQKEFIISDVPLQESEESPILSEPPQYLHISVPITVNVIGVPDRDNCITVEDQMKQKPCEGIHLDMNKFLKEYFEETAVKDRPIHPPEEKPKEEDTSEAEIEIDKEMTRSVVEQIVSDALFSDYFRETLKILKTEPSPLYSQIQLSQTRREEQRQEEVKRFLTHPDLAETADVCQRVLVDALHAKFHLGPVKKKTE